MTVKEGEIFCGQHMIVNSSMVCDENIVEIRHPKRVECPYDHKHSCYENKLKKHMAVCNSRPKEKPLFIIPGINCSDHDVNQNCRKLADLNADELVLLLQKIEFVYNKHIPAIEREILNHASLSEELKNFSCSPNKMKHLLQNSSLLGHAEKSGLLQGNTVFVEFGAGRGQLSYYIAQIMKERDDYLLLLVDRASQRHKFDNKLKETPSLCKRIRADIADLYLENIPDLHLYKRVVGLGKHLCGSATDFALRCLIGCDKMEDRKEVPAAGILMALCCHHRCDWGSYTGKDFMLAQGFTAEDFHVMCGITSWATCGPAHSRGMSILEEHDDTYTDGRRPLHITLTEDERKKIGRNSKALLNYGRQVYLENQGYKCKQFEYVTEQTSPENICILAKRVTQDATS
jgi:tRNA:m4X modification enzyme